MKKILFFGFFLFFLTSCNDSDDNDSTAIDCTSVACTEIFITLIVSVQNTSGTVISLDRFEVIDQETSEEITLELSDSEFQMATQNGQYPLYNDSFISENQNTIRTLVFKGFINNEKLTEAQYMVSADCCHVSLTEGNPIIIIK